MTYSIKMHLRLKIPYIHEFLTLNNYSIRQNKYIFFAHYWVSVECEGSANIEIKYQAIQFAKYIGSSRLPLESIIPGVIEVISIAFYLIDHSTISIILMIYVNNLECDICLLENKK